MAKQKKAKVAKTEGKKALAPKTMTSKKKAKNLPKKSVKTKSNAHKSYLKKAAKPAKAVRSKPSAAKKEARQIKGKPRDYAAPPYPIKGSNNSVLQEKPEKPSQEKPSAKRLKLPKRFLDQQKQRLLELRDHILDQMQGVAQDNLRSRPEGNEASAFGMHQADAGSDAYEKDFALSLLSKDQDALYEVEEALKRIENGSYGVCEMSNEPIPSSRLEAIPFARFTLENQKKVEIETKGKGRWDTAPQFMESTENFFEESEESDEEEQPKVKE
jgi:RNA polymerase-binding transcription factor DksA